MFADCLVCFHEKIDVLVTDQVGGGLLVNGNVLENVGGKRLGLDVDVPAGVCMSGCLEFVTGTSETSVGTIEDNSSIRSAR